MTWMPGKSAREPLPELSVAETRIAENLRADVRALAGTVGERNMATPVSMTASVEWLERRFAAAGYRVERHEYDLRHTHFAGQTAVNLAVEVPGTDRPHEIVVIGAHYDTVEGSPGANDNASGVAVLLALSQWFHDRSQPRTLRFVAFANEEPPYFLTPDQGSYAYAARCREHGERIVAMMSLDGLGYYSNEPGSQQFPFAGATLLYPDRGDFLGFVTRLDDARLLRRAIGAFRETATIPSEGIALPSGVPGVSWSDHWSFWQHGYPAFFITDTLPFRYPHYHLSSDTADRLDYARMARVVKGLHAVVDKLSE